jgi:hypothetical protein
MSLAEAKKNKIVNGIDVEALSEVIEEVKKNPAKGVVEFRVTSAWKGQTQSETSIDSYTIGGEQVQRQFKVAVDEPLNCSGRIRRPIRRNIS